MEESRKLYYGFIPRVLNEELLSFLCNKHKGEIGLGVKKNCPRLRIRYVIDKNRFGYADFGDFFFWEDGGLYVWQQSEEFEEDHNPDIVEDYFGHSCEGRGYTLRSIFAGIDVKWLMGEDEPETKRHKAFVNPLKGVSYEDCWENIWKD